MIKAIKNVWQYRDIELLEILLYSEPEDGYDMGGDHSITLHLMILH
ncbi:hypothetical protein HY792_06755 [Candidatus Desantisbacteria bacterium]|nr:hypothetical protein [Candidatus Desantisbacteria bacterium]